MKNKFKDSRGVIATIHHFVQVGKKRDVEVIGFDVHSWFMDGDYIINKTESCKILLGALTTEDEYVILEKEGDIKIGDIFYLDSEKKLEELMK